MGQVTVHVNGRSYTVGCDDGEEDHVRYLADFLDTKVQELVESVGQVGEARLLLLAGLTVSDDLSNAYDEIEKLRTELAELRAAAARGARSEELEHLAKRLEDIALRLENP